MTLKAVFKHYRNHRGTVVYSGGCKNCKKFFYHWHKSYSRCKVWCGYKNRIIRCKSCKKKFTIGNVLRPKKNKITFCSMRYFRKHWRGKNHPVYKGGSLHRTGYKYLYINKKLKFEHRHKMEEYLGRKLRKFEYIHHKNGIRHDNRIRNLELWASRQPKGQRVSDIIHFICTYYPKEVFNHHKIQALVLG